MYFCTTTVLLLSVSLFLSFRQVHLAPTGDPDLAGWGTSEASAVITRVPLLRNAPNNNRNRDSLVKSSSGNKSGSSSSSNDEGFAPHPDHVQHKGLTGAFAAPDPSHPVQTLVNLLYCEASETMPLRRLLVSFLARLDDLSHVLVWTDASAAVPNSAATSTAPPPPPRPSAAAAGGDSSAPPPPPPPGVGGVSSTQTAVAGAPPPPPHSSEPLHALALVEFPRLDLRFNVLPDDSSSGGHGVKLESVREY